MSGWLALSPMFLGKKYLLVHFVEELERGGKAGKNWHLVECNGLPCVKSVEFHLKSFTSSLKLLKSFCLLNRTLKIK